MNKGCFRYSTTSASTPASRKMSSAPRDLLQLGLWYTRNGAGSLTEPRLVIGTVGIAAGRSADVPLDCPCGLRSGTTRSTVHGRAHPASVDESPIRTQSARARVQRASRQDARRSWRLASSSCARRVERSGHRWRSSSQCWSPSARVARTRPVLSRQRRRPPRSALTPTRSQIGTSPRSERTQQLDCADCRAHPHGGSPRCARQGRGAQPRVRAR